jgi:hypothetical protein
MAYRSSSQSNASSTAPATAVPSGAAIGDIAIIFVSVDLASIGITLPSGFTQLDTQSMAFDGEQLSVGWKRLTAADTGSYTCSISSAHDWVCSALLFSGRHATNPPVITTANKADSSHTGTISIPASTVTALAGDDICFLGGTDQNNAGAALHTFSAPASYTLRTNPQRAWEGHTTATRDNVSAGATGTVSGQDVLSTGAEGTIGWLIRIPSAGGTDYTGTPADPEGITDAVTPVQAMVRAPADPEGILDAVSPAQNIFRSVGNGATGFIAAAHQVPTGATMNLALPVGAVQGGWCLVVVCNSSSTAITDAIAGSTVLLSAPASNMYMLVLAKQLTATDISNGFLAVTSTTSSHDFWILAYDTTVTGFDSTNSFPLASSAYGTRGGVSQTFVTAPSTTPNGSGDCVVLISAERTLAAGTTVVSIGQGTQDYYYEDTVNTNVSLLAAHYTGPASGVPTSSDTVTYSGASGNAIAFLLPMTTLVGTSFDLEGITDTAAPVQALARLPVDPVGLIDAASVQQGMGRTVADPVGLLDTATTQIGAARAPADPVGLIDAAAAQVNAVRALSDPLGLLDVAIATAGNVRPIADPLGLLDAAAATIGAVRQVDDALGITDSVNAVITPAGGGEYTGLGATYPPISPLGPLTYGADSSAVNLGVGISTSLSGQRCVGIRVAIPADAVGTTLTGAIGYLYANGLSGYPVGPALATATFGTLTKGAWNEARWSSAVNLDAAATYYLVVWLPGQLYGYSAFAFSGAAVAAPSGAAGLTFVEDNGTHHDGVFDYGSAGTAPGNDFHATWYGVDGIFASGAIDYIANISDSVGITDSGALQVIDYGESVGDSVGISDAVTANLSGAHNAQTDDVIGLSDSVTAGLNSQRLAADAIGISDTAIGGLGFTRTQADPVGLADSSAIVQSLQRVQGDVEGISDAVVLGRATPMDDPTALTDHAAAAMDAVRAVDDQIGLSDFVEAVLTHTEIDYAVDIEESLGISDLVTAVLVRGEAPGWHDTVNAPLIPSEGVSALGAPWHDVVSGGLIPHRGPAAQPDTPPWRDVTNSDNLIPPEEFE